LVGLHPAPVVPGMNENTTLTSGASDFEELATSIRQHRAILFVGAGASMSVGLPSWRELIEHMAEELGVDPQAFTGSNSHHTLAEFYRIRHGSIGSLRSWMDRHWKVSEEQVRRSKIHELMVDLEFPIIYTTNYDRNLEVAFETHHRPFVSRKRTGCGEGDRRRHADREVSRGLR
jgi:hypothetical protein